MRARKPHPYRDPEHDYSPEERAKAAAALDAHEAERRRNRKKPSQFLDAKQMMKTTALNQPGQ